MPKKRKAEPLPADAQIVRFEPGEFRSLFVAAKDIGKVVIGYSSKTAANDRSAKRGCRYYMVGGRPYYKLEDLENYFGGNPVETFNSD